MVASENRFWIAPPVLASQKVARPGRNCLPDAFELVNQEVVIELVDEEPTEEMISAGQRFWEKVFAELLGWDEERSVREEAEEIMTPKPSTSNKITEKKFRIEEAAAIIGISPAGVRLLLNNKKLGYYQSGKRRIIGEGHLNEYLNKIERNKTKETIY